MNNQHQIGGYISFDLPVDSGHFGESNTASFDGGMFGDTFDQIDIVFTFTEHTPEILRLLGLEDIRNLAGKTTEIGISTAIARDVIFSGLGTLTFSGITLQEIDSYFSNEMHVNARVFIYNNIGVIIQNLDKYFAHFPAEGVPVTNPAIEQVETREESIVYLEDSIYDRLRRYFAQFPSEGVPASAKIIPSIEIQESSYIHTSGSILRNLEKYFPQFPAEGVPITEITPSRTKTQEDSTYNYASLLKIDDKNLLLIQEEPPFAGLIIDSRGSIKDKLEKYFAKFPSISIESTTALPVETIEQEPSTYQIAGSVKQKLDKYFAHFPAEGVPVTASIAPVIETQETTFIYESGIISDKFDKYFARFPKELIEV
jgi:hypothetical protein